MHLKLVVKVSVSWISHNVSVEVCIYAPIIFRILIFREQQIEAVKRARKLDVPNLNLKEVTTSTDS